ncbi:MAG: hypothetical protein ABR608_15665 [Pseudonocardiaceae bacterium]
MEDIVGQHPAGGVRRNLRYEVPASPECLAQPVAAQDPPLGSARPAAWLA